MAICTALLFTGLTLAPPAFPPGLGPVFRIVSVALVVISVYGVAMIVLKGGDPKAAAFLARTGENDGASRE